MQPTAAIIFTAMLALPALSSADDKVIYGSDDRMNYYEAPDYMRRAADSVVSLWSTLQGNGSYFLNSTTGEMTRTESDAYDFDRTTLREKHNLCPGERYLDEPVGAFCSGALVGEDLVLTAAHCIKNAAACNGTFFVFGYKTPPAGTQINPFPRSDVYRCKNIITRYQSTEQGQEPGNDYALIKLDRKVAGRAPLQINRTGRLAVGTELFAVGHPLGLPVKMSDGATVRQVDEPSRFWADLDAFKGSSGGPVFNLRTRKIEGILVAGAEELFVRAPTGCYARKTIPMNGKQSELITKISVVSARIPATRVAPPAAAAPAQAPAVSLENPGAPPPNIPLDPFR